ncbi:hypothetical protein Droror1_Dr00005263 [Drosera rotundifolia]
MGCVSSTLVGHNDEFPNLRSSTGLSHHIVSLTSTTYGLLTLDSPSDSSSRSSPSPLTATTTPPTTPEPQQPRRITLQPEIINSWELMAGLDTDSFRFPSLPPPSTPLSSTPKLFSKITNHPDKENLNPNKQQELFRKCKYSLDGFERVCPPNGENRVILYTTTLRGVRETFEACNAVRAAFESLGVQICERDVSMDCGFRDELRGLLRRKKGSGAGAVVPPRVFVKGRYIGGAEEVLRIYEEGCLADLLEGLPRVKVGHVCDGCGGTRFLPCFMCNGSCKVVMGGGDVGKCRQRRAIVVRCSDCNENGLVLCPICS